MREQATRWRAVWLAVLVLAAGVVVAEDAATTAEDADAPPPAADEADADGDDLGIDLPPPVAPGEPMEMEAPKRVLRPLASPASWGARVASVSGETTRFTAPLRADGGVNFAAAVNAIHARGLKREDNAVIPLMEVLGPGSVKQEHRAKVKATLQLVWDDQAGYFQPWLPPTEEEFNQLEEAQWKPWTAQDYPYLAAWLLTNDKHLDRIVQAVQRPRFHAPLLGFGSTQPEPSLGPWLPYGMLRWVNRALCARAMQRLDAGNIEKGWEDVLSAFRMARLIGSSGSLLDRLVACSIEAMAADTAEVFAQQGRTPGPVLVKLGDDLRKLQPMGGLDAVSDIEGRATDLALIDAWSRRGTVSEFERWPYRDSSISIMFGPVINTPARRCRLPLAFDAGQVMREHNRLVDRVVAAYRRGDGGELNELADKHAQACHAAWRTLMDAQWLANYVAQTPAKRREMMTPLISAFAARWATAAHALPLIMDRRVRTRTELTRVTFALVAYHEKQGKYPDSLADLAPDYMPAVSLDPMGGKPLRYERSDSGCIVYSVGRDGDDDGGIENDTEGGGDIAVTLGQWPAPAAGGDE